MFVTRDGEGSEVCFGLHGWSGTHTTFAPLVPHLPPGAALYSVDLPGYGQSLPPRRWDLAGLTDEIGAAIAGLGAEALTLIGNCSGALLGLLAAERVGGASSAWSSSTRSRTCQCISRSSWRRASGGTPTWEIGHDFERA